MKSKILLAIYFLIVVSLFLTGIYLITKGCKIATIYEDRMNTWLGVFLLILSENMTINIMYKPKQ